jgi:type I restriction enzyme S subunit
MNEYKVRDLLTIKNGKDHKHLGDGKYPVYGSGGIMRYVDSYLYDKPSILLPRKGTLDNIQYCDTPFWCVDTTYYSEVNTSLANPYYLYRYLSILNLKGLDSGTALPSMTFDSYYQIKVSLPNIEMQNRIGNALYQIDQKIALNTRMNAELEAMAKQLYDYWFVQFDFPDENGNPYKSSGGKMVYNSTLKHEIPAGWEVKNLNQIADIYRGVTYNKEDLISESDDSILVLRGNNIPSSGQFAYDSNVAFIPKAMVSKEQKINKGDIIITMSSGSKEHIGKCFMFQSDSNHTYGAFLSKIVPSIDRRYFIYLSMLSEFFKAFVKTTCNGTGINNLTNDTFNNVYFSIPNTGILSKFESLTGCLYNKVGINQRKNNELTHLRDSLLPMLMNGQVTVE